MQLAASFTRPFTAVRRAYKAVRSHQPVPCWTEYMRNTRG